VPAGTSEVVREGVQPRGRQDDRDQKRRRLARSRDALGEPEHPRGVGRLAGGRGGDRHLVPAGWAASRDRVAAGRRETRDPVDGRARRRRNGVRHRREGRVDVDREEDSAPHHEGAGVRRSRRAGEEGHRVADAPASAPRRTWWNRVRAGPPGASTFKRFRIGSSVAWNPFPKPHPVAATAGSTAICASWGRSVVTKSRQAGHVAEEPRGGRPAVPEVAGSLPARLASGGRARGPHDDRPRQRLPGPRRARLRRGRLPPRDPDGRSQRRRPAVGKGTQQPGDRRAPEEGLGRGRSPKRRGLPRTRTADDSRLAEARAFLARTAGSP